MTNFWNLIKKKISNENGILSIGFSDILGSGLSSVFWLYLASSIKPEEYGEIHYFLSIAGMAQVFSMFGSSQVITVYTAKKEEIQSTLFLLSIIPSVISSVFIIIIFNKIDAGFLVLGYVIFESVNSVLLGRKFYRKYAKIVIIQKALTLALGVSFLQFFGPEGIIFAIVLTFVPHLTIYLKEFKKTKINFSLLISKKKFIINNYLMNISNGFGGQIDKVILAPLLGFVLLGNYSLALQIFSILIMFSTIIFKFILPQDASGISNKKLKIYTIIVSIIISILGIVILPKIITEFFPKFLDAIDAIPIMSIAVVPEAITIIYVSKMLGKEKSKFILIAKLIDTGIVISGFIILGPIYGIIGLAWVMVAAVSSQTIFLIIMDKLNRNE